MIWTLVSVTVIVLGWYWDRQLFKAESGLVCENIHPPEAKAFLDAHPHTQVLDVRSDAEFSGGAFPGAIQISFGDAEYEQKASKLDKTRPVLVYCAGGFRSSKAAAVLKIQRFTNIQHLHRGYHSWRSAGFPVDLSVR